MLTKGQFETPYFGLSSGHQVLQLQDLVVDGGAVALLDGIVRRALLPFVRQAHGLAVDGDAVDGQLLAIHHNGHRSQNGSPAHQGLPGGKKRWGHRRWGKSISVRSAFQFHMIIKIKKRS